MKRVSVFLLALLAPAAGTCEPTTVMTLWPLIDQVIQPAAVAESTRPAALDVLERIAQGRRQDVPLETARQAGLDPQQARNPSFGNTYARVCAIRGLGRTGLPEAVAFLQSLKEAPAPDDRSQMAWAAVQIALREAVLVNIEGAEPRERFLQGVLEDRSAMGQVGRWAIEELCNSGGLAALPEIRSILTDLNPGPRGVEEAGYCEARMQVVASDPDRARALGTVFSSLTQLESTEPGRRLLDWAYLQLNALHTPSADIEVERLAKEFAILHKTFPSDAKLSELAEYFSEMNAMRKK